MTSLEIRRDGELIHRQQLTARGMRIGRAPDNDLALAEATISSYHCSLFVRGASIRVRDLGSTNGTFVDDAKVEDVAVVAPGGTLRLGPSIELIVSVDGALAEVEGSSSLFVYQSDAGCYHAVDDEWCSLGELLGDANLQGWQLRERAGQLELSGDDEQITKVVGDSFKVGAHALKVLDMNAIQARTKSAAAGNSWQLKVFMSGRAGPVAQLTSPGGDEPYVMRAANRVAVLYLLAQQTSEDLAGSISTADQGWCPDDHLMRGVWGRRWEDKGSASFQVLIHRVRKDLEKIGIGGDVIEKRSGFTRLRPGRLTVAEID